MAIINFIDFNSDRDLAHSFRGSPQIEFYDYTGIQLLPNNPLSYVQSTNVSEGIELEDWTASIVKLCDGTETDITDYFLVERVFTDDNGMAQFDWSLTDVPFDFGKELVYLKVDQLVGETFYSNVFELTNIDSEKTARLDYRNRDDQTMQSIQFIMWYWQQLKNQELKTYYETSTGNTVTATVKSQIFERWLTDVIAIDLMIKLSEVMELKYVYLDLERTYLFEAVEIKELDQAQNFSQNTLKLAFNKNDVYDPLNDTETTINIPQITLNDVFVNGIIATYLFSYSNFTPTYLTFQTSQDQVNWNDVNKGVTNPQSIPFNGTGLWYFRIEHPEAVSNILTIDFGESIVAVNDTAQASKGSSVDINVLFNDTLIGTTTITSITDPTNGTAQLIGGDKIRYTHNDSATSFDTFSYTISNGLSSDSATVSVTIVSNDGGGSGNSTGFNISTSSHASVKQACLFLLDGNKWHNGTGAIPVVNDFVYNDAGLLSPFNGNEKYYAISGGKAIKIDSLGRVQTTIVCEGL